MQVDKVQTLWVNFFFDKFLNKDINYSIMVKEVEQNIKLYDACASEIAEFSFPRLLQYQLNQFISSLPRNAKILDVGCGCGRDVNYFLEEHLDPVGIDLSNNILDEARRRVETGNFVLMDMLDIKFDHDFFDGIWCMSSLDHIPKNLSSDVIKKFYDLLVDGGILYVSVPEGEGEKVINFDKSGNMPRFCAYYDQNEIESMLKSKGFSILTTFTEEDDDATWINLFCKKTTEL